MEELMLLENPSYGRGNPSASEAMSLAHQLREEEGLPMDEALSQAWDEVRGEDTEGIEDTEDIEDIGAISNVTRAITASPMGKLLALTGLAYLTWCGIKYSQNKYWSWTPWQRIPMITPRVTRVSSNPSSPEPQITKEELSKMMDGVNIETVDTVVPYKRRKFEDTSEEIISVIEP